MDSTPKHPPNGNGGPPPKPPPRGDPPPRARSVLTASLTSREFRRALWHVGRGLVRHIVRHNPAYLVSALLMIAGVYSILQPSRQELGNLSAILATFATFQVYELLLVAIVVFLVCSRRVMDDGATVALIEAFFVVGAFVILDEVTFRDGHIVLGLCLGLVAAVLATGRFAALALTWQASARRSAVLLGLLALLFAWNAGAPALVAHVHDIDSPWIEVASLSGWWVLPVLALGLAVLASRERGELRPRDQAFVESALGRWAVVGVVVAASGVHQYWIGYVTDVPFTLSEAVPLVTALCVGAVCLLAATRSRPGKAEHAVAALPAAFCLVVLLAGEFEPVRAAAEAATSSRALYAHEARTLTWPTAWLGLLAVLTLLHAWRRRSAAFANQAALVAGCAALFSLATAPEAIRTAPYTCADTVAVYLLIYAVARRSPWAAVGFLAVLNVDVHRYAPEAAVRGIYVPPVYVVMASVGASCFAFWVAFRRTVSPWVTHAGAVLVMAAAFGVNFSPSTQAPSWALSVLNLSLGGALAAVGWTCRWWGYYGLSAIALSAEPGRTISRTTDQAAGPSRGWLLILASFVVLALGFLLSTRKAPSARGRASSGAPASDANI